MKNKILLATAMTLLASPAWATVYTEKQSNITSETSLSFDGDTFSDILSTSGSMGAVFNNAGTLTINNSVFQNNSMAIINSHNYGGAIQNNGGTLTITNSQFISNTAKEPSDNNYITQGGAIQNASGTVNIDNTIFTGNKVNSGKPRGAAIWNVGDMTITNSVFQKNEVINSRGLSDGMGSAVYNTTGRMILESNLFGNAEGETGNGNIFTYAFVSNSGTVFMKNNTFRGNQDGAVDIQGNVKAYISGNHLYTGTNNTDSAKAKTAFSVSSYNNPEVVFGMGRDGENNPVEETGTNVFTENNAYSGSALNIRLYGEYEADVKFLGNTINTFSDNTAVQSGGALVNEAKLAFETGSTNTFTNNIAGGDGGAIYNTGTMTLAGTNVFSGNKANGKLNDIHNLGTINVSGNLTLDGGVSGNGTMTFASGSNLFVKTGTTTISNEVINQGATLNLSFDNGFTGTYTLITDAGLLDTEFTIANNALYDVKSVSNGVYEVSKKSAAIIAEETNATQNQANTIAAVTSGDSDNATFNAIADNLNEMIQSGDAVAIQMALEAVETLAPEVAPVVMQTTSDNTNQIFSAVSTRMSGGAATPAAKGLASGDAFFEQGAAWVQTLYNHAELENTRQARGYESDSKGLAFGFEKQVNYAVKAGIGYAYTQTDIDSKNRSTDVDTHTAIVYGEYRPSAWFVNGMASYSWSDYDEEKMILFNKVKSDYKAESYALQAMTGVELMAQNTVFTPEAGLRYVHVFQDGYKDTAGQYVYGAEIDALTGIAGLRMEQAYEMENDWVLRPSARFAVTYDIVNDNNNSAVALANGSTYNITGEPLKRFGMEADFSLTAEVSDNVSVSLGYQGKFRDHYEDHTGMLNFRYEF